MDVLLLLLLYLGCVAAQQTYSVPLDPSAKAAIFVDGGYVFALNKVENGDVYFHMNAPAVHSWMGIGFSDSMGGSFMLVSYRSANGHNLTTSPRIATGQNEPTYEPRVIEGIYNDSYAPFANTVSPNNVMIAHSVCRNCSTWSTGSLDTSNTAQPFIFALGPKQDLRSDSLEAPLRLHEYHGSFTLDMTRATNTTGDHGRVPAPQESRVGPDIGFQNAFSSQPYSTGTDQDWSPALHAVMMCLSFVLIFPLGSMAMRLTKRWVLHASVQAVGFALVLVGFGSGVYMSRLYNKSKRFNSAHQIIGLFVFALLFLQTCIGLLRHFHYQRAKVAPALGGFHRYLGVAFIALGLVNGGIGFNFANHSRYNKPYAAIVAVVAALVAALVFIPSALARKRARAHRKTAYDDSTQYEGPPPAIPPEYEMNVNTHYANPAWNAATNSKKDSILYEQRQFRDNE